MPKPAKPLDIEAARDLIGLLRILFAARGRHDPPHRAYQQRITKLAKELTAAMGALYATEVGSPEHDRASARLDAALASAPNASVVDGLELVAPLLDVALHRVRQAPRRKPDEDEKQPPKWVLRQMRG